jgi:hypothetical protein
MGERAEIRTPPATVTPVQILLERAEIVQVVDSVADAIDAHEWSYLRSLFMDEVEVDHASLNGGETSIVKANVLVGEWRKTLTGFDATQHVVTNHAVRISKDAATCSAYVNATHYLPNYMGSDSWTSGSRTDYGLVRTRQGWKVRSTRLDMLWAEGNRQLFGLAQRRFEEGLTGETDVW